MNAVKAASGSLRLVVAGATSCAQPVRYPDTNGREPARVAEGACGGERVGVAGGADVRGNRIVRGVQDFANATLKQSHEVRAAPRALNRCDTGGALVRPIVRQIVTPVRGFF